MGSNHNTKLLVAAGKLCYVCETNEPVLTDFVGGNICMECHAGIYRMLFKYAQSGGYSTPNSRASVHHDVTTYIVTK